MPVYEYLCNACNHQFDLRQKFSDAPADRCPKCGGVVHKMVSTTAFNLKGGGWFGDGYNTKAETPKPEADKAAGTGDAPTETTASPATQAPTPSQSETKNTVVETPATTTEKVKSE